MAIDGQSLPKIVLSGTLAGVRTALGPQNTYWLQYGPPIFGLLWFSPYWRIHGRDWNWTKRIPALITVSVVAAPCGFTYDQTLMMIPVIYLAASSAREFGRLPSKLVVIYPAMNVTVLSVAIVSTPYLSFLLQYSSEFISAEADSFSWYKNDCPRSTIAKVRSAYRSNRRNGSLRWSY